MLSIKLVQEGVTSMRKIPVLPQLSILGVLCLVSAPWAHADSIVNAADDIYAAGGQTTLISAINADPLGYGGGNMPGFISTSGVASFTFSVTGLITINAGGGPTITNDADGLGLGVMPHSSNTGAGSISGITAPGQGYLVGVFIGPGGPSGSAPTALDFVTTSFTSFSPLLDQTFFIGDGMTGDGSGAAQTFIVPTGATELYLGISDALGYNGAPGAYFDNVGTFDVAATAQDDPTAPEPSSFLLFGTGILGMAGLLRRKLLAR
jgi:hypothetical protein